MKTRTCVILLLIMQLQCFGALAASGMVSYQTSAWSENPYSDAQNTENRLRTRHESMGFTFIIKDDGTAEIVSYSDPSITVEKRKDGSIIKRGRVKPLLEIPRKLAGYTVTSIGPGAFYNTSITEIIIPDCVTSIGNGAFAHSSSLERISIPNSITYIGDEAFLCCLRLVNAKLPDSLITIGEGVFASCISLDTSIVPPDHARLRVIDGVLFDAAEKKVLWYPASTQQSDYDIPEGTIAIGKYAFGNEYLKSVTIPDSVEYIGKGAFTGARSLNAICIPEGITVIEPYTFSRCGALAISIPESVTCIGERAFDCCLSLEKVYIPDHVTVIDDYAFSNCRALTDIIIPNGVTSIGEYAFSYCTALTDIYLPRSLAYIGDCAFRGCDILSISAEKDSYAYVWAERQGIERVYDNLLNQ